ncbi:hypothetical protein B0H11DRAFT_1887621 [Mycena galericulata]|nr:hypothetical protein B0H11DRAFT_1887621 [Mycena galericulata]
MAESVPVVQILDKSHFTKQHLVSLPDAYPLPPLTADSIRIVSRLISITSNNFTYARLGHLLGWWDVWAQPPSLPAPYDDGSKFGRVSAWGYAEVLESTHPGVPAGTQLYGYLPIGTLPEDLHIAPTEVASHYVEVSPRRNHLWPIYNRYIAYPPIQLPTKTGRAWDALMRVLFETSYVTNRYAFAWAGGAPVHPSGPSLAWTPHDASVADAIVVLLAPSGKTALALAHQLRHARPTAVAPRRVIGVGSASSRAFTRGTGLFDDVLLYDDFAARDLAQQLGIAESNTKIVLVEFGARGEAALSWFRALQALSPTETRAVIVGSDPAAPGRSTLAALTADPNSGVVQLSVDMLRTGAMRADGAARYFAELEAGWAAFKDGGAVAGVGLKWGEGMEAVKEGWDRLAEGKYGPDVGLVFEL